MKGLMAIAATVLIMVALPLLGLALAESSRPPTLRDLPEEEQEAIQQLKALGFSLCLSSELGQTFGGGPSRVTIEWIPDVEAYHVTDIELHMDDQPDSFRESEIRHIRNTFKYLGNMTER